MTDYKAEALAMCPNEPNHGGGLCSSCGRIAAALEATAKRERELGRKEGHVEGLREAVGIWNDKGATETQGGFVYRVLRHAEEVERLEYENARLRGESP